MSQLNVHEYDIDVIFSDDFNTNRSSTVTPDLCKTEIQDQQPLSVAQTLL